MTERNATKNTQATKTSAIKIRIPALTRSMSIETLEWWSSWTTFLAAIAGGVAALLVILAWFFSHNLSKAKDEEFEIFRANAEARISEANASAATATERTETLELRVQEQRERAALAESALLELRLQVQPRRLSEAQVTLLANALAKADPKGLVAVSGVMGDVESNSFASQLATAMRDAGWDVSESRNAYMGNPPRGIGILVKNKAAIPERAKALSKAFSKSGIPLQTVENPGLDEDAVTVMVGAKPE